MNRYFELVCCSLISVIAAASGCGSSPQPSAPTSTAKAKIEVTEKTTDDKTQTASSLPSAPQKPTTDSALASVEETLDAIKRGDLVRALNFLPAKYQSDVDDLVHEFANQMDADVWAKLFATLRKFIEVLRTRKPLFLELDLLQDRVEFDFIRRNWDASVGLLESVVQSDLSDLTTLRTVMVKSLLPGEASELLRQLDALGLGLGADLAQQFSEVNVQFVRANGNEQVLTFQGPRDEKPVEIIYIKHEERWLPKSLVEQWSAGIETDRAWLAKLPEQIKAVKPRLMESLSQTEAILDQILAAQNREEFAQAVGPAILSLATAWPRMQQLAQQSASNQPGTPPLIIVINRELSDSEQSRLIDAVFKPLQASGTDYTVLANDGKTTCRVTRVSNIPAIREALAAHFGVKSDRVLHDEEMSRVRVELDP